MTQSFHGGWQKASEECEPTMEAPQEVAQQADNPEASSAEAAAAAAGMPSESAATTQGGLDWQLRTYSYLNACPSIA